jgi:hypothetical protein
MSRGKSFSDDDIQVITEAIDEKIDRVTSETAGSTDATSQRMTLARLFRTREKVTPAATATAPKPSSRSNRSAKGAGAES